jgi:hypothetical protein
VLTDLSDRQLGLLAALQIWRELFLDVSLAFSCGTGEVVFLER